MVELAPFEPWTLVLFAALNPVVVIVAVALGRQADQWQKVLLAGFAAALAGAVALWLIIWLGFVRLTGFGGEGGIFIASIIIGSLWAAAAYRFARK